MWRIIVLALACSAASSWVFADTDVEGYNEYTIRPSDVPSDAPRFDHYPAKLYRGPNARPEFRGNAEARQYRTRLSEWAREKPNFAGHYVLATWGCGTDCTQISIIDARTGKIFFPPGARTNAAVNVHHDLLGHGDLIDSWHGTGAVQFRPESKLLVLIGMPEENVENRGISYFVWDHDKLKRIRLAHKMWYPGK